MGIFDNLINEINFLIYGTSSWIQRRANSELDIEKCNGKATEDSETKACALCVSVNKCFFINDINKMPLLPQHPNCKCKINKIKPIREEEISFIFPISKLYYVFDDILSKAGLILSWGYKVTDAIEIQSELMTQAKKAYAKGDYLLHKHDFGGQRITIKFWLDGKREKLGRKYFAYSGWIIYPNAKLYMATPIIRREK